MKKTTIKDIAKKLGLVHSTVSKALKNDPLINIKTRELIVKTAREMNYFPNLPARSLKTGKTHTIGFVLPEFGSLFAMEILKGAEQARQETNYSLHAFTGSDIFPEGTKEIGATYYAFERAINESRVDAVIYSSPMIQSMEKIRKMKAGKPIVLVEARIGSYNCINFNNRMSGFISTEYLIKKKKKNIAFVVGPYESILSARERFEGYKEALNKYGLEYDEKNIFVIYLHYYREGQEIMERILKSNRKFDAINCAAGDAVAFGIYNEARKLGVDIPGDMLLIGHDNHEVAEVIELTTIEQPMAEMGRKAFEIAVQAAEGKIKKRQEVEIQPKIIVRKTA